MLMMKEIFPEKNWFIPIRISQLCSSENLREVSWSRPNKRRCRASGVNFINILWAAFSHTDPICTKKTYNFQISKARKIQSNIQFFVHLWDLWTQKHLVNLLVKLTQARNLMFLKARPFKHLKMTFCSTVENSVYYLTWLALPLLHYRNIWRAPRV